MERPYGEVGDQRELSSKGMVSLIADAPTSFNIEGRVGERYREISPIYSKFEVKSLISQVFLS